MTQSVLEDWNRKPPAEAETEVLPCNGARQWAAALAGRRPFASADLLFAAADSIWAQLPETDWHEAFASHPRLGERHAEAATATGLQWSAGEQSGLQQDIASAPALAQANQLYEQRFGRIFLVCAAGKSAAEVLALLERRLRNDAATELQETAEQQRRITQLRLRKWLGLSPAHCEDV